MSSSSRRFLFSLSLGCWSLAQVASAAEPTDYEQDIKPVLAVRCYACHGALKQEGGLRLDTGEFIRQGGDSGPAVQAGQIAESLLLERVSADDLSYRMPPEGEPLAPDQIVHLQHWIEQGTLSPPNEAPEQNPADHWAFVSPMKAPIPTVADPAWSRHPIDAFVAQQHAQHQVTPQPPATKSALLRRVYLDLIGLPPTRDELREFLADESPDAYEHVVDRLLASPQYGERWARHWMDVWRYSDWFGRRMVPDVWNSAPQIWRWRDWIVRSLNQDLGYDQMVAQMLAGDEVAPDDPQAAYATGYLIRNWYALNPNDWMRSNVEHTAKAFLGLTFNCAHCHDHKYDPITQEDYFRLRAFFEPIGIRQDRVPGEADPGPFQEYDYSTLRKVNRLGSVQIYDKHPEAPTWFYTAGDERNRVNDRGSISPGVPTFLAHVPLVIEPLNLPPTAWYPGLRSEIQATLLDDIQAELSALESKIAETEAATATAGDASPDLPHEVVPTFLDTLAAERAAVCARRASLKARIAADIARHADSPSDEVDALVRAASHSEREANVRVAEAALLAAQHALALANSLPEQDEQRTANQETAQKSVGQARTNLDAAQQALAEEQAAFTYASLTPTYPATSTGRRRALANWMTHPSNPLPARVAVNHIWLRHFHAPLVETVYDFGRSGARPTHPQLLDWLAVELIESGWSIKHLHRLIVTSQTYRLSSHGNDPPGDAAVHDPENKLLWRMNVGRMESEVLRDSLLYCAGQLDLTQGGQELENSEALTTRRRTLYYSCHPELDGRSQFGALFDAPEPTDCYRRTRSVLPQQALALTNSQLVHELSQQLAQAVWNTLSVEGTTTEPEFITALYESVLSRSPTPAEHALCLEYLNSPDGDATEKSAARRRASLVRIVLNQNDFISIR